MKIILTGLAIITMTLSQAQNIEQHQWKNRLILVLSENQENKKLKEQLAELESNIPSLKDRKLVIYSITPTSYRTGFNSKWNKGESLYKKYATVNRDFEVVLIGLDGGAKLRQHELLTKEMLFATIDQMPMRKAELNKKD